MNFAQVESIYYKVGFNAMQQLQRNSAHLRSTQYESEMNIENVESIKKSGFCGFKKISELRLDFSSIPKTKGVYLVLRPKNSEVEFVEKGTGGFFRDINPNVDVSELKKKWLEKANIIYIDNAGDSESDATLYSQLKQYISFGQGNKVGHWDGRYIWQIKDIDDYIICWKELPKDWPTGVKLNLMELFWQKYDSLPFANLKK
ncbi:MAG: hypothetical protein M1495_00965 [Bacteroidetes bacterium]|nr:hypothetical protein [Bacteroidota bacterium]